MQKPIRLLWGCVAFQISGDAARFCNAAAKCGVPLWGFDRTETGYTACCLPRDYKRLRPLAQRTRVRLRITQKSGLPFRVNRIRQRPGFLLGMLLGVSIFWFLSGFYWGIEVTGTQSLGDIVVLEAAANNGAYIGARKAALQPRLAAHGILREVSSLSWAAVNTDGCYLTIKVREADPTPDITDDRTLTNIVASREGVVVAIEAERGRPEVALGQTVQTGQLLIAGSYEENVDPWAPNADDPYETLGAARGRVVAETYREFAVQVSATIQAERATGRRKVHRTLNLFGIDFPLGVHTTPTGSWQHTTKTHRVTALGAVLPITITEEIYTEIAPYERTLTREEQQEHAMYRLRRAQRAALPQGATIEKETVAVAFSSVGCVLSAQCHCREEIGKTVTVLAQKPDF